MATNNEISNTSFTNKDFNSIYPELLDLVKKLTNKWDPSLSNESDPGVLLLKLNALIADKNNYNIDKNVLECFPTSVTQEGNARRLYDSLGYKMHWYKSATTNIGFQLRDNKDLDSQYIPLTALDTMVTDSNSEIVYTLLQDVYLSTISSEISKTVSVEAIEGKINRFTINGNEDIYLDNLDSNYRLYFIEENVAENGVFVKRKNDMHWTDFQRVDNVVSYPLGQTVYEFGVLPNSNVCYIQFPEDIANLLQDSGCLNVRYITSSGTAGNIKSGTLDSLFTEITATGTDDEPVVVNDKIKIIQTSGTINGENPETIDAAYNNYKRTVGTFNTLVTRRDYENYIYNAKVGVDNLVSNCVVADRTCDLNASTYVQTYGSVLGQKDLIISTFKQGDKKYDALNAYNIVLYALNAGDGTYDSTFEPNSDGLVQSLLESMVSETKAIEHDFLSPLSIGPATSIYYLYKNLFALRGQIVTYNKVTKEEAKEIEQNVKDAIQQQYNARQVQFGKEVDYNDIIETIKNADPRIRTVALDIPKYQVEHVDGTLAHTTPSATEKLRMVARMILSGNVQLFTFDEDFNYEFGQQNATQVGSDKDGGFVKSITTKLEITLPAEEEVTLKENEVLQLYAPNYIVDTEYSTYVKFNFYASKFTNIVTTKNIEKTSKLAKGSKITAGSTIKVNKILNLLDTGVTITVTAGESGSLNIVSNNPELNVYNVIDTNGNLLIDLDAQSGSIIAEGSQLAAGSTVNGESLYKIDPGVDYLLKSGEVIKLSYTNQNGIKVDDTIPSGKIVNISTGATAIYATSINDIDESQITTWSNTLLSGQTLQVKKLNQSAPLEAGQKVYFFLNNSSNTLKLSKNSPYILQEDEYFIFSNSSSDELMIHGSGTMLSCDTELELSCPDFNLAAVQANDIENINWIYLTAPIVATDLDIITIGEGATIKSSKEIELTDNSPAKLDGDTKVIINEASDNLVISNYPDSSSPTGYSGYSIQSRLNLNSSFNKEQYLISEDSPVKRKHIVVLTFNDSNSSTSSELTNCYLSFNNPIILSGGNDRDAGVLTSDGVSYSLKAYTYGKYEDAISKELDYKREDGVIKVTPNSGSDKYTKEFLFDFSADKNWLLPVQVYNSTGDSGGSLKITIYGNSASAGNELTTFNTANSGEDSGDKSLKTGSYILRANYIGKSLTEVKKIIVEFDYGQDTSNSYLQDTVNIGKIYLVTGINKSEIDVIPNDDNNYNKADEFIADENIEKNNLLNEIQSIIKDSDKPGIQFNYTYKVPNADKVLQPTLSTSYWNINHICNRYTIPMIDFSKYNVVVNPYSIKE